MRANLEHEVFLRRRFGNRHPVGRGTWESYRYAIGPSGWTNWVRPICCQWCGGDFDNFDHEDVWDAIRKTINANGATGYVTVPTWFPSSVCSKCGEELTPFIHAITDIGLLRTYASILERIITHVRQSNGRRIEVNWAAPVPVSQCCKSGLGWFIGPRKGDDAEQTVEEHQRQPVLGNQDCDVSSRRGHQAGSVRQDENRRSQRGLTAAAEGCAA